MAEVLKDKVAVVTGSGQGIGRGVGLAMAREGARVVVSDIIRELAEKADFCSIYGLSIYTILPLHVSVSALSPFTDSR